MSEANDAAADDGGVWAMEEQFWTGGAAHYAAALDPACVMAFPAPVGVMAGPAIAASLAGAPRWASVLMRERQVARPSPDLLVLGYRARGRRDGAAPYEAYCTSAYRRAGAGTEAPWKLVQHQQTPVP